MEFEAADVMIDIPAGAVQRGLKANLTVASFMCVKNCSYPEHISQISPILLIHPSEEVVLCKPIAVTLPHFLQADIKTGANIGVLKASINDKDNLCKFVRVPDCKVTVGLSRDGDAVATIYIQHFCFLQLYTDVSVKNEALKATYCLCRLDPRDSQRQHLRSYYYVLTYRMKSFIKVYSVYTMQEYIKRSIQLWQL